MSSIYSDDDYQWQQPDPKIKYLIERIKAMSRDADDMRSRIAYLESEMANLTLEADKMGRAANLLLLLGLGEIDKEEVRSIMKMMESSDRENHTVAIETIQQLIQKVRTQL